MYWTGNIFPSLVYALRAAARFHLYRRVRVTGTNLSSRLGLARYRPLSGIHRWCLLQRLGW
jgi:hypothetical protein